jgi:hypothetical protein
MNDPSEGQCDLIERDGATLMVGAAGDREAQGHIASCASCRTRARSYDRLIEWLHEAPPGRGPLPGWEVAIVARLRPVAPGRQQRQSTFWLAVSGGAIAAAAVVLLLWPRPGTPPWSEKLQIAIVQNEGAHYRSGASPSPVRAAPGDQVAIDFATGGFAQVELRVFRGGQLVFRCPGPGCSRRANRMSARVPLPVAGQYQLLLIWARNGALPEPAGGPAEDAGRLVAAGARVRVLDAIAVR